MGCDLIVVLTVTGRQRRLGDCAVASSGGPEVNGDLAGEHYAEEIAFSDTFAFPLGTES